MSVGEKAEQTRRFSFFPKEKKYEKVMKILLFTDEQHKPRILISKNPVNLKLHVNFCKNQKKKL